MRSGETPGAVGDDAAVPVLGGGVVEFPENVAAVGASGRGQCLDVDHLGSELLGCVTDAPE